MPIKNCALLQKDFDTLEQWCNENRLPFNIQKCKFIRYSLKANNILFQYSIQNSPLTENDQNKDHEIIFKIVKG